VRDESAEELSAGDERDRHARAASALYLVVPLGSARAR
jgi:hypothetical protein